MKYIVYSNKTNKVIPNHIYDEEPTSITKGTSVARCEYIPKLNLGEYYEVFNVQEHFETYTEKEPKEVTKVDEFGKEYIDTEYVEVEKTRPYKTCSLIVKIDTICVKKHQLIKLKRWFDKDYRETFEKFTRWQALGKVESVHDDVFNVTYYTINDLYVQGEFVRATIKTLETELGVK